MEGAHGAWRCCQSHANSSPLMRQKTTGISGLWKNYRSNVSGATRRYLPFSLALLSLLIKFAGGRRNHGGAGRGRVVRGHPELVLGIRTTDRGQPQTAATDAICALASGRDGKPDCRPACVPSASRRRLGEVLGISVQKRRDAKAATSFQQKLLRDQPVAPESIVTDGLKSDVSAVETSGLKGIHTLAAFARITAVKFCISIRKRERHMQRFKSQTAAQEFSTVRGAVYNTFYTQRHIVSSATMKPCRAASHQAWKAAVV